MALVAIPGECRNESRIIGLDQIIILDILPYKICVGFNRYRMVAARSPLPLRTSAPLYWPDGTNTDWTNIGVYEMDRDGHPCGFNRFSLIGVSPAHPSVNVARLDLSVDIDGIFHLQCYNLVGAKSQVNVEFTPCSAKNRLSDEEIVRLSRRFPSPTFCDFCKRTKDSPLEHWPLDLLRIVADYLLLDLGRT